MQLVKFLLNIRGSVQVSDISAVISSKMADKIGLKQRNGYFGPNLRLGETDFKELFCLFV